MLNKPIVKRLAINAEKIHTNGNEIPSISTVFTDNPGLRFKPLRIIENNMLTIPLTIAMDVVVDSIFLV